jgi:hypothetical protein
MHRRIDPVDLDAKIAKRFGRRFLEQGAAPKRPDSRAFLTGAKARRLA